MAKGAKILLVEDHADSAAVVARLLRWLGHDVRRAATCAQAKAAAEAEAAVEAGPFDLLLCDIGLPDGDGCELLRELRQRYGLELEGVAMTGYVYPADRERCLAAGFSRFLPKPFDLDDLRTAVAGPPHC